MSVETEDIKFRTAFMGYQKSDVDAYVTRVKIELEKQEKPEGLQYIRDLINEYSEYIKIKSLLPSVGISSSNYYVFRAGSDSHLSEEKAVALFKTLLRRPIK